MDMVSKVSVQDVGYWALPYTVQGKTIMEHKRLLVLYITLQKLHILCDIPGVLTVIISVLDI